MKLGLHWGGVLTVMGCRLLTFVVFSSESEVEQIGRAAGLEFKAERSEPPGVMRGEQWIGAARCWPEKMVRRRQPVRLW